ncbi:TraB/GumN family protein, partial [Pedobacter sp. BAL39]|uniref:TraB/GumN family protein n=1 Tax=Pedobacter sp. BAL39 TaxID=391596 RepID=UPI000587541E
MNLSLFSSRGWTHYAFLLIFAALHLTGTAQDKKPYNLLWEISGNGLKKSSYLFGSMHVKDRRAFNFSDSVLIAMETSSAFAITQISKLLLQPVYGV